MQLLLCQLCRTCPCQHNYIEPTKGQLLLPKALSAQTLNTITADGRFDLLFGNRQTQAGMGQIIRATQQGKMLIADFTGAGEDLFILGRSQKSLVPSKAPAKHGREARLY